MVCTSWVNAMFIADHFPELEHIGKFGEIITLSLHYLFTCTVVSLSLHLFSPAENQNPMVYASQYQYHSHQRSLPRTKK